MSNADPNRTTSLMPFAAVGVVGMFVCWREIELGRRYSETPQVMTCSDLGERGPGENVHVSLTAFRPCEQGYVYYDASLEGHWESVYIPLCPAGQGPEPAPEDIRVIARLGDLAGENELWKRLSVPTESGIVVSNGSKLGGWDRRILADFYPGMQFDRCWVIDFDRRPPQKDFATYGMAFCVVIAVFGLGVVAWDYFGGGPEESPRPPAAMT